MGATQQVLASYGASFVGPLDDYTTDLAGAWSVARRLLTDSTGAIIRARRSSDNAETDIGTTASGELDTASLLAFTGAGNGFLSKIYDQSGAGLDYSQATAARQLRIVLSGVVDTNEGKPSAFGVNASDTMMSLASSVSSRCWMDSALATRNNVPYMGLHSSDNAGLVLNLCDAFSGNGFYPPNVSNYTLFSNGVSVAATVPSTWCYPQTKVLTITGDATSAAWYWGTDRDGLGRSFEGYMTERLIYSAIPANVAAISQVLEDYLSL